MKVEEKMTVEMEKYLIDGDGLFAAPSDLWISNTGMQTGAIAAGLYPSSEEKHSKSVVQGITFNVYKNIAAGGCTFATTDTHSCSLISQVIIAKPIQIGLADGMNH
ncbi:MAG: hypothetical protein KDD36_10615 [Flavobacteriales bacterium]|nr:hypothetical protein [Flavobacteriales bacterium]